MNVPTSPPPASDELNSELRQNIQAMEKRRAQEAEKATREEKVAQAITTFTGSMRFVYLHLILYGGWIVINLGWIPPVPRFDPSFVVLAMVASVEAIFLSTFVLISQNRMAAAADKRADLDLQVNLLAEHEISKLSDMVAAIADKLDARPLDDAEVEEMRREIEPDAVLDEIEVQERKRQAETAA